MPSRSRYQVDRRVSTPRTARPAARGRHGGPGSGRDPGRMPTWRRARRLPGLARGGGLAALLRKSSPRIPDGQESLGPSPLAARTLRLREGPRGCAVDRQSPNQLCPATLRGPPRQTTRDGEATETYGRGTDRSASRQGHPVAVNGRDRRGLEGRRPSGRPRQSRPTDETTSPHRVDLEAEFGPRPGCPPRRTDAVVFEWIRTEALDLADHKAGTSSFMFSLRRQVCSLQHAASRSAEAGQGFRSDRHRRRRRGDRRH